MLLALPLIGCVEGQAVPCGAVRPPVEPEVAVAGGGLLVAVATGGGRTVGVGDGGGAVLVATIVTVAVGGTVGLGVTEGATVAVGDGALAGTGIRGVAVATASVGLGALVAVGGMEAVVGDGGPPAQAAKSVARKTSASGRMGRLPQFATGTGATALTILVHARSEAAMRTGTTCTASPDQRRSAVRQRRAFAPAPRKPLAGARPSRRALGFLWF